MNKFWQKTAVIGSVMLIMTNTAWAQVNTNANVPTKTGPLGRVEALINDHQSFSNLTTEQTIFFYIGQIISVFFGLLGTIFIFLTVYAGYNWMTAMGDKEKLEKAQKTLKNSIIGLIVTAGSYAIWQLLFVKLFSQ